MNTCSKVLSITLSLIALAYLPSAAAETSDVVVETVVVEQSVVVEESILNQEGSLKAWPKNAGIQF